MEGVQQTTLESAPKKNKRKNMECPTKEKTWNVPQKKKHGMSPKRKNMECPTKEKTWNVPQKKKHGMSHKRKKEKGVFAPLSKKIDCVFFLTFKYLKTKSL
jgi:hypothetical protein